jgi:(E)-4-hydroxy-3-methylbut-2-enyl-diphosphate synthase
MERRITKTVNIDKISIGSSHPIAVQTMYSLPLPHIEDDKGFEQIMTKLRTWATMGCHLVRFSYPDSKQKESFAKICQQSPIPIVADIHFDWRLAIEALNCKAAKIRINPGNIGAKWKVEEVVKVAKERGAAIRIGLNSGSLPRSLRNQSRDKAMVDTALEYLDWFESWSFNNTVISLKDTDVETTYNAYKMIASQCDVPLHLGVTEAGGLIQSSIRSTWALGRLLGNGIGDTIRISITDECEYEIIAARELLRTLGLENKGIRIVSCPRCGRSSFDSQNFLKSVEAKLMTYDLPLTVAIMGCQVNGPGEAEHADLAITGIGNKVFLYEKGKMVKEVTSENAESELFAKIEEYIDAQ